MTTQNAAQIDIATLSAEWSSAKAELDALKVREMELRKTLVAHCFPAGLNEGTNTYSFNVDNWQLKAVNALTRELDIEQFRASVEIFKQAGIDNLEELVDWKPSLNIKAFKALNEQQQEIISGACLTIKPGSPQVKIIQAKR